LWRNDPAATNKEERNTVSRGGKYDQILRIYAGYDETGVWQEFGEMKFETKEDITPEFGNPNPEKPRWVPTRYVPWTSWAAGMQQWGLSSIRQGENSGTIMHELGHSFFSTGDNNNNPYAEPYRRVGSGPWDMMDRGSFNGPGGPHMRWVVPVQAGGSMPAGLMLRQKINFGFLSPNGQMTRRSRAGRGAGGAAASQPAEQQQNLPAAVLFLSRTGLAKSGLAVATVTARAVDPLPGEYAGIMVRFDGEPVSVDLPAGAQGRGRLGAPPAQGGAMQTQDRTPWEDPATHPLSEGIPNYDNYTLEVVQRMGYDSFCPDSGVLLAKNKDRESSTGGRNGFNCFNWVIDAHPEDIHQIDFKRPKSGTPVYRTVADFRQLNDALFHAGTNSGSFYEWEDTPNRLHFYIVDVHHNAQGILSYTMAVRSLDGAGPHTRGVALDAGTKGADGAYAFTLKNTGKEEPIDSKLHPQDVTQACGNDVYRLKATVEGDGWTAVLPNALAAVKDGESQAVKAYAVPGANAAGSATLVVTATSESDPTKTVTTKVQVTK
jgi:M6 family metalloprotease-like protein